MATFSTNQVRQLFVVKAYSASAVTSASAIGTISVHGSGEDAYFLYRGVSGVMRSDLIKKTNLLYGKATPAAKMARGLKKVKVALDSTVNSGNPVAGQDYLLRIAFKQHFGLSNEDQYFKYGAVRVSPNMTAEAFYLAMIESLEKNFQREITPLLTFTSTGTKASATMTINTGITVTAVDHGTAGNDLSFKVASVSAAAAAVTVTDGVISASLTTSAKTIGDLKTLIAGDETASALITISGTNGTAVSAEATAVELTGGNTTGIIIEEVEQPWILGKMESRPVNFVVQPDEITVSGTEYIWGVVTTESSTTTVTNGKLIADLEYFAMGERGDIYRGMGYPKNIITTYLVNPTAVYSLLDLHYYYAGDNEAVQKSEKDIALAFLHEGETLSAQVALANNVIGAFNTAAGTSLSTLPTS